MTISLSYAIDNYLQDAKIRMSPHTISDYSVTFKRFREYFRPSNPLLTDIQPDDVRDFLYSLDWLSNKSLENCHVALSSLWTWAIEKYKACTSHIIRMVPRPKPDKTVIVPFTQIEVKKLLSSLGYSRPYSTKTGLSKPVAISGLTQSRDLALILFLLDSGLRVSELCGLMTSDIRPGDRGVYLVTVSPEFAKFSKGRMVPISSRTWQAVTSYLALRGDGESDRPLFTSLSTGERIHRSGVRYMLNRLSDRSGVQDVYPHRFRHTFATNFLRNGGDAFTLQAILGHSTMDMVKTYVAIANTDLERNHAKASPVTNWEL